MEKDEFIIDSQNNPEEIPSVEEAQEEISGKTKRAIYSPYKKERYRPTTTAIWKNKKFPRY